MINDFQEFVPEGFVSDNQADDSCWSDESATLSDPSSNASSEASISCFLCRTHSFFSVFFSRPANARLLSFCFDRRDTLVP